MDKIIPKLTFELIDNVPLMIRMINRFLTNSTKGFNWSGVYAKEYPELGEKLKGKQDSKEIEQISSEFFTNFYNAHKDNLEIITKDFQAEWDKDENKLLKTLSEVVEKEWTEDCKEIKAWVSLNPICPRYLKQRTFEVFWKYPIERMKATSLHEILHFIWFEKWKDVFKDYKESEFEAPNLVWKLSEMVPVAILNDNRLKKIFNHEHSVYKEWENKKINDKPLLCYIKEMYDNRKDIADFMVKSYEFVKANEEALK